MGQLFEGVTIWTIIDKIVAYLFIIVLFWGAKNKFGKKDEFNEDFLSLDAMKSIRGIAAIGVILHHISQEYFFQEEGVLSLFVNAGAYFVAIFFFCSGYGLLKSFDSKPNYLKGFIKKRIVKAIVVPFYVNVLIYGLFQFIVKMPLDKTQWVTNLLGVTMMNRFAWFPIVLAILYLLFYLCFRFIKNRYLSFGIILVFIIGMGVLFCFEGHYAWWAGPNNWWIDEHYWETQAKWWMNEQIFWFSGEWWANSAPAFLAGLIFANFEKPIVAFFKKKYILKFHVLLVVTVLLYGLNAYGQNKFGYWTEFAGNGPEIGDKLATYFLQIPLLFLFPFTVFMLMMKFYVNNPVTQFFGKYSLHTYLMNLAAITLLRFIEVPDVVVCVGDVKNNLLIYAVSVIILTVLFGVGEQNLTERIQKLLFVKKQPVVFDTSWSLIDDSDTKHLACVKDETTPKSKEKTEAKAETKTAPKTETKSEVKAAPKAASKPASSGKKKSSGNKKNGKKK